MMFMFTTKRATKRSVSRILPLVLLLSTPVSLILGRQDAGVEIPVTRSSRTIPVQTETKSAPAARELVSEKESEKKEPVKAAPKAGLTELTTKAELQKVLTPNRNLVFKIGTDWCGACHMIEKPLAQAAEKYKDNIDAFSLDADKPGIKYFVKGLGVTSYPTLFFIHMAPTCEKELGTKVVKELKTFADFKKLFQSSRAIVVFKIGNNPNAIQGEGAYNGQEYGISLTNPEFKGFFEALNISAPTILSLRRDLGAPDTDLKEFYNRMFEQMTGDKKNMPRIAYIERSVEEVQPVRKERPALRKKMARRPRRGFFGRTMRAERYDVDNDNNNDMDDMNDDFDND